MFKLSRWQKKRKSQGYRYQAAVPQRPRRVLHLKGTFEDLLWGEKMVIGGGGGSQGERMCPVV